MLVLIGVSFGLGVMYVIVGALAVVIMPIAMGREGVGTAMITLFTVCVMIVVSGVLLLAARSAARIIRRERQGVRSLYLFSLFGLIVVLLATGIGQWLSVAFYGMSDPDVKMFNWSIPVRIVEVIVAAILLWVVIVLRRFDRQLPQSA